MGQKRHISALLLAVTTILMLVAALLPHHHHEAEVCFAESHCLPPAGNDHDRQGCPGDGDHEHDQPSGADNCFMSDKFLVPYGKVRTARPESGHPADGFKDLSLRGSSGVMPGIPCLALMRPGDRIALPDSAQPGGGTSLRGPPAAAC